jgi:prefoldin subunit 5
MRIEDEVYMSLTTDDLHDLTAELEAAKAEIERLREERRQIARHHNEMCTCLAIL